MRGRELEHLLRDAGRGFALAPLVVEHGRHPEHDRRRQRMAELLDELLRITDERLSAIGIAEQPLHDRALVSAARSGIVARIHERLRRVLLFLVDRDPARHVWRRRRRFAHGEQGRPHGVMGFEKTR